MNANELREKYYELYDYMAQSKDPKNMKMFGRVMSMMFEDMAQAHTQKAEEYVNILEGVKWKNYVSQSEAEKIVSAMQPEAPWKYEQWKAAMEQHGYELERWPDYNKYSLYVVMEMIMSDSSNTIKKYVADDKLFDFVYDEAVDKLTDADKRFSVREYFKV